MQEPRVSKELARKLIEAGFYWSVFTPTLNQAAMWLRDVHGLHLSVLPSSYVPNKWYYGVFEKNSRNVWERDYDYTDQTTHDTALYAGIEHAVDLVIEKLKTENDKK